MVGVSEGYSLAEADKIITGYIDLSATRLRQRLLRVWHHGQAQNRKATVYA